MVYKYCLIHYKKMKLSQKIIEFALSFYFSNALIPGKFFPSKLSNIAPPPVET